jgi:hypothetical protein
MPEVTYREWYAIHDHMTKTLRVGGECSVEGGGFALRLESRISGIGELVLELNLLAIPTGESPVCQMITWEQPWADSVPYTTIQIVAKDGDLSVPPTMSVEDIY